MGLFNGLKNLAGFGNYDPNKAKQNNIEKELIKEKELKEKRILLKKQTEENVILLKKYFELIFLRNDRLRFFDWSSTFFKNTVTAESLKLYNESGAILEDKLYFFDLNLQFDEEGYFQPEVFVCYVEGLNHLIKQFLKTNNIPDLLLDKKLNKKVKPQDPLFFTNGLMFDCKAESLEEFSHRYADFLGLDLSKIQELKDVKNIKVEEASVREKKLKELELIKLKQRQLELELELEQE